jgi:diguanylate cyclase (GGDEF)-like protein
MSPGTFAPVATRIGGTLATLLRRPDGGVRQEPLHEPLTGLLTQVGFRERLRDALARARRHGRSLALLFLDVDRLTDTNHRFGYSGGDELLRHVAKALREVVRGEDSLARLGGDEFAVLLDEVGDEGSPARVAQRILSAVHRPVSLDGRLTTAALSIGIATSPQGATSSAEALLGEASIALDAAKQAGGNRFELFDPSVGRFVRDQLRIEEDLARAIDNNEFVLHYQPEIDVATEAVVGVEALVRWNHPVRGMLPPDQFIPLAEQRGLIEAIGVWTLEQACRTLNSQSHQASPNRIHLNVNVSPRQLTPTFVRHLERVCRDVGFDPHDLVVEIIESTLVGDVPEALRILHDIDRLGVRVAIDDFGTGYSSFSYLRDLPVSILKLDRSFVRDIHHAANAAIVRAVLQLGEDLGLTVIAEGVETPHQRECLEELGCRRAQGFLFGRPVSEDHLPALLDRVRKFENIRMGNQVSHDVPQRESESSIHIMAPISAPAKLDDHVQRHAG